MSNTKVKTDLLTIQTTFYADCWFTPGLNWD